MQNVGFVRKGFTLIELLVVIAIIAILAAILFPTFAIVREKTRQTTCMTQMQAIHTALKLYKEDNGKYPPSLFAVGTTQKPIPAGTEMSAWKSRPLYQYSKDREYFVCPDNVNVPTNTQVNAVYPPGVPLTGQVMAGVNPATFFQADSYDIGLQVDKTGQIISPKTYELHYSLDWTGTVGAADPKNQLKYPDPPADSTVITWCTYHAAIAHSDTVPVLMLNGTAKASQVKKVVYDPALAGKTYAPLNFQF